MNNSGNNHDKSPFNYVSLINNTGNTVFILVDNIVKSLNDYVLTNCKTRNLLK